MKMIARSAITTLVAFLYFGSASAQKQDVRGFILGMIDKEFTEQLAAVGLQALEFAD